MTRCIEYILLAALIGFVISGARSAMSGSVTHTIVVQ
jgi:Flp pilus assembly pilin Flp